MAKPQRKPVSAGAQPPRELIRRTTAMTDAMVDAFRNAGLDVSRAKLPVKRETTWSVTRRG